MKQYLEMFRDGRPCQENNTADRGMAVNDKQKRLRFVIACEVIDNVRLMKPHGMLPYTMYKHYGYESEVLTYRHGDYPYLENELKGLKIRFLRSLFYKKAKWPFFLYLARNARNIDVLMVYNVKKRPIYNGLIYKLFNPRGFLYAKADTSRSRFGFYVDNAFFLYRYYMRFLGRLFLSRCNAVSVESSDVFNNVTQVPRDKLLLMPCGFDPDIVDALGVRTRSFDEKENIVLHVARMGAAAKNSEHLLRSIARMEVPEGWRFVFAGGQTPEFKKLKEELLAAHPQLADVVAFYDHLSDKAQLYDLYSRAKIFCLPSKTETFGNVLVEAQHFGNAIAGSEHLPSVRDLIDGGRAGITFSLEREDDMAERLAALMRDQERLRTMSQAAIEYAEKHLVWRDIAAGLDRKIREHYEQQ